MNALKIEKRITNRNESDALDRYLRDIAKYPILSSEEEVILARRIKAGDPAALEQLVNSNLRFVVSVAKQYLNQGINLEDLINEGNLGLIKAAGRFDETRGFKFISFAVWWIRQAIIRAISDQSRIVRLPVNQVGFLNKVKRTAYLLEQKLNRKPSFEEIADEIGVHVDKIINAYSHAPHHISMDAKLDDEDDSPNLYDRYCQTGPTCTEQDAENETIRQELNIILGSLPAQEADVLKLHYGLGTERPLSFVEIGRLFNLSDQYVKKLLNSALRRLRHNARCRSLVEQLD